MEYREQEQVWRKKKLRPLFNQLSGGTINTVEIEILDSFVFPVSCDLFYHGDVIWINMIQENLFRFFCLAFNFEEFIQLHKSTHRNQNGNTNISVCTYHTHSIPVGSVSTGELMG